MTNYPVNKIENIFGISIAPTNNFSGNDFLQIKLDPYIYERLKAIYGDKLLRCQIPTSNYVRYKNGKLSSMIRGEKGIVSHEGFEELETAKLIDDIFFEVSRAYAGKILYEFSILANSIFNSIVNLQQQVINVAFYFKEQDYVEELASIKDFFEEIHDEIGEIAISKEKLTAYISNIIEIRRKIYKIYSYFIAKLNKWSFQIAQKDIISGNYTQINFEELNNDYIVCRQSISCYMICLVYEAVIAGNIDDKSRESIIGKIRNFINRFKGADEKIRHSLSIRNADNSQWDSRWYPHKGQDSMGINWFLDQIKDKDFEEAEINNLFDRGSRLLSNIIMIEDNNEDR